ncbi:MAG: cadmium-translocating P-type ATPase [Candidatus Dormibacteraeota bacterium]|nr:cadmium-translocating P-type ATPase [Candidatus Dormibacteraeota bacterium]
MPKQRLHVLPAISHGLTKPYRIAHAIPGRVRLVLDPADVDAGLELADRLAVHPNVESVRWRRSSRSLVVTFEEAHSFTRLLATIPSDIGSQGPAKRSAPPAWQAFLVPALALASGLFFPAAAARAVLILCGLPIARRSLNSLLSRHLSIDVLDFAAVALLIATGDVFAGGVTIALIESGERIRRRASGQARNILRGWMGADPRGVRVLRNGEEPYLPMDQVALGDLVVVYAGETVPVDGQIAGGSASIDARTWTGETMPRPVGIGAQVLAGSALYDGRIVMEVTATGDATRAGKLTIALESAIAANTQVSDLVYRIADRFVLPVLTLSGGVFWLTRDLNRLISMLIIDFGSGFRVSIPTAILTTMVAGARQDVLFKSGRAIEAMAKVDTVVFDKTGTLTAGHPEVVRFDSLESLRLAAIAEGHLQHPIARAIRRRAERAGLTIGAPEEARYQVGGGVMARIEGRTVLVGDARLLEAEGITVPRRDNTGSSVILIAVDGRIHGRIRLSDKVKPSAQKTIDQLRRLGVKRLLLATGDQTKSAQTVAKQLGLDGFHARLMPEDKIALVRSLTRAGARVALVGDGINDAGAMAEASVSVAMPLAADLARETADVVLLGHDLAGLVTAVTLARNSMAIVKQNIGVVGVPNSVGMGLAMAGFLNPLSATVLNNGSTLLAAANALRPLRAGRRDGAASGTSSSSIQDGASATPLPALTRRKVRQKVQRAGKLLVAAN